MTIKQKFERIDQSKLEAKQVAALKIVSDFTENFKTTDKDKIKITNDKLDAIIGKLQEKNPDALKPLSSTKKGKKVSSTKTPKRNVFSVAKQIQKSGESFDDAKKRAVQQMKDEKEAGNKIVATQMQSLLEYIKKHKELEGIHGTDLRRDSARVAKVAGRRISKNGNVYYERRENRMDRLAPHYPQHAPLLESGAYLTDPTFGKFQNIVYKKGGMLTSKERYVLEIKGQTGLEVVAIEKYIDDNNLNESEVLNIVVGLGRKQLKSGDMVTAVVGKPNNAVSKQIIAFAKSDNAMKLELGGNASAYNLAGQLGGDFNVGQNIGDLSGTTGAHYTGLVGETPAMSSGEMFSGGGQINEGLNKKVYALADKKGITTSDLATSEYNKMITQALIESLTDANYHPEAKEIVTKAENKKHWSDDLYKSEYFNPNDKVGDFAREVARICEWDGLDIVNAYYYTTKKQDSKVAKLIDELFLSNKKGYVQVTKTANKEYVVAIKNRGGDWRQFNDIWNLDELEKAEKFAKKIAENHKVEYLGVDTTPYDAIHKKSFKKYIPHYDIASVTVNKNGKEVTYKGSDVLNGANELKKGGDLTKLGTYVAKRDVVSVTLKNGNKIKPANGYWIAKKSPKVARTQFEEGSYEYENGGKVEEAIITKDGIKVKSVAMPTKKLTEAEWLAKHNESNEARAYKKGGGLEKYSQFIQDEFPRAKREANKYSKKYKQHYLVYIENEDNDKIGISLADKFYAFPKSYQDAHEVIYLTPTKFDEGGNVTFDEKSHAIAEKLEYKRVEPKYQKEYGKVYSEEEAEKAGDRIAGSMVKKEKMAGGAKVKKHGGSPNMKIAIDYAKANRKAGESWQSALKRGWDSLK